MGRRDVLHGGRSVEDSGLRSDVRLMPRRMRADFRHSGLGLPCPAHDSGLTACPLISQANQ